MRSIWNGSNGFGLANIPIKLYSAVQESNLDLDMLDEQDQSRIRFQRINEKTHKEVPFNRIVKAYLMKDRYIILDEHDFEEAAPVKNKIVELENFVAIKDINPIYYETSFYSEPEKQGAKAYSLLLKALIKSKKAGIGRFVLRNKENLCVLHPYNGVILISKIRFQEEIRSLTEIKKADNISVSKKELDVGLSLIEQYSSDFNIKAYKDTYKVELLKIIKLKAKGKHAIIKKLKPKKATSDNLYDQLLESLGGSKRRA